MMKAALHFASLRFVLLALAALLPAWSMSVQLESPGSPTAVIGTEIIWSASLTDESPGTVWYQYRVRTPDGASFRVVRDFSPEAFFRWVPTSTEGYYQVEVTARHRDTGE